MRRVVAERFATTAAACLGEAQCEPNVDYPFTPFLGARVRAPFDWRGHHFETGTLVLLDVYGAQHDPLRWTAPEEFRPERFAGGSGDAFDVIPQGGGDPAQGHRCAGEWITMHQLALALHFLTRCIRYDVPAQDLSFDLSRMPTRPESGFIMRRIQATPALLGPAPRLPSAFAEQQAPAHAVLDERAAQAGAS